MQSIRVCSIVERASAAGARAQRAGGSVRPFYRQALHHLGMVDKAVFSAAGIAFEEHAYTLLIYFRGTW